MADISKEAEYVTSNDIEGMIQLEQLHSLEKK
jgi:NitT/TauT family transport system substrate-binding protein